MEINNLNNIHTENAVDNNPESSGNPFDFIGLMLKILRYWYLFVICIIIAIGLAQLEKMKWTPTYRIATTLLIEDSRTGLRNDFTSGFSAGGMGKGINNQMMLYTSHDFISRAVDSLNLTNEIYLKKRFKNIVLYKNAPIALEANYIADRSYGMEFKIKGVDENSFLISYAGDEKVNAFEIEGRYDEYLQDNLFFLKVKKTELFVRPDFELHFRFLQKNSLVNYYRGRLSHGLLRDNSSVIEISLTGKVAQRDIDFLNILNKQFFEDNLNRKNAMANKAISFIDDQIAIIRDSVNVAETKLSNYQTSTGLYSSSLSANRAQEVEALNKRAGDLQLRKNYISHLSKSINNTGNDYLSDPGTVGVTNSQLASYISQYNDLVMSNKKLGENNPLYQTNKAKLDELNNRIKSTLGQMQEGINLEEAEIKIRNAELRNEMIRLPQKERQLLTLERDHSIHNTYYTYLLQRRIESGIQKASNEPDNLIVDYPRNMGIVNVSDTSKTLMTYCLIGLLIPLIFVICKEFLFKHTVQSRDEVEKISRFPIVATIERSKHKGELVILNHPRSSFAEGFRSLRSRMEYIAKKEKPISMLITSTEPRDGKTFIALNLASMYKLGSKKVIVVDFDLRRPAFSKTLGLENTVGLTSYLIGKASMDEIILKDTEWGFDVIPAGVIPPNPSELIRTDRTADLLKTLYQTYDYVLLDCSPVGLVADAHYLSRLVDVVLYVIRNDKTNKNFLKYTTRELKEDGIQNVAVVYNDVDMKKGGYYGSQRYYGKSSYYIKHGNYYHND